MQVRALRRTSASLLAGGLVAGLLLLASTAPVVAATPSAPTPAATVGGAPLNIVLLGDSYSAGNGATNDAGQPETYGPADCYRSRFNWTEKYAAALRDQGRTVTVENHACSGGKSRDIVVPRVMDTASKSTPTPAGVTTLQQADAYLAEKDFCNTRTFPDEEFWTYQATSVDQDTIKYSCTRKLRPQADFVTADTDLVLFTMGGNDAGFTDIVTQCFILKMGSGCQGTIEAARAKLPQIKQLLLDDVAGIRAAGLRDDAKIVQVGYPYLQLDNGYLALGVPPYAAGDAVRSLIDDGTEALAGVATAANAGHPGQMTFVRGIKEAFAGHEPDATTPVGNVDRWVNQVGDGTNTSLWYHPNALGQSAYASVVLGGGDYGATPPSSDAPSTTSFRAQAIKARVTPGDRVKIRTTVKNADGSRPRGKVLVRLPGKKTADMAQVSADGRNLLRLEGLRPGRHRVKAVYVAQQQRKAVYLAVVVRRR